MKIGLQAWGSEGDIQPFTALAAGLVKAGHSVTLVVSDNIGRDYSDLALRFGYQLVSIPNPQIPTAEDADRVWRQIIDLGNPIQQAELVMKHGFDPIVEAIFAAARQLCAENDAVVGHFFVYPLRVAAEKAGVSVATLNVVHNCVPSAWICPPGLPDVGRWSYRLGWRLVRTMVNRIFLPRVNALRRREGLQPETDVMGQTWAADKLNLIAVSPQICQAPPDWDARHQVCGFLNPPATLLADHVPEDLDAFLSAGSPPVYLTFGSMMINNADYLSEVANIWDEAIRRVGCRAIIQLPWGDLDRFSSNPDVFALRRSPYSKVFPRCSMIVHHGGAGTTQSSLLAGRPSIIVAHVSDQFFWGSELERLGVGGTTLRRKGLTPRKLARAISHVLATPALTERAIALGTRMSDEDGIAIAIQRIEKNLS
jgi:UDP:flavonoid glycosyltransferase YjiC (YdhE family)